MKTSKNTLVLGASDNPERYSYLAVNRLRHYGHTVFAIGKKRAKVADVEVETAIRSYRNVHTVTLYLNPMRQKEYYDYIISLRPQRIIFNPGAENRELAEIAAAQGIQVMNACTLVLLSTNQF